MRELIHTPVLLREVLDALQPAPGGVYIDGTVGLGGHAEALLDLIQPGGRFLACDRDPRNLALAESRLKRFGSAVVCVRDSYAEIPPVARRLGFQAVDGILLDLGYSSAHVEDASRGFSFQLEGPLDMRYDPSSPLTAADIVNGWGEDELAALFRTYGEEPNARAFAKAIVGKRRAEPFTTTLSLSELLAGTVRARGKTHPATRVFQALRIAVNDEFGELTRAIPGLIGLLKPGGRLAVISFHSLEDRIVKDALRAEEASGQIRHLTKHVLTPSREEFLANPRARSAKLRVAERLA